MYCKGVGKIINHTRWSRPEALNALRELTRAMQRAGTRLNYLLATPERGWTLKPEGTWNEFDENY